MNWNAFGADLPGIHEGNFLIWNLYCAYEGVTALRDDLCYFQIACGKKKAVNAGGGLGHTGIDHIGYIFYESKFRKEPLSLAMIREEMQQVQATGLNCYRYGFFSRSGFQCEPIEKMVFIRLDELYL